MARVKFVKNDARVPQDNIIVRHSIWHYGRNHKGDGVIKAEAAIELIYQDKFITVSKADAEALIAALETAVDTFDNAVETNKNAYIKELVAVEAEYAAKKKVQVTQ